MLGGLKKKSKLYFREKLGIIKLKEIMSKESQLMKLKL